MARLTGIGFVLVGLIGFAVKVIFIPINQVGAGSGPLTGAASICGRVRVWCGRVRGHVVKGGGPHLHQPGGRAVM